MIVPLEAGPDLADRLAVLLRELVPPEAGAAGPDPDAAAIAAAEAVAAGFGPHRAPTI